MSDSIDLNDKKSDVSNAFQSFVSKEWFIKLIIIISIEFFLHTVWLFYCTTRLHHLNIVHILSFSVFSLISWINRSIASRPSLLWWRYEHPSRAEQNEKERTHHHGNCLRDTEACRNISSTSTIVLFSIFPRIYIRWTIRSSAGRKICTEQWRLMISHPSSGHYPWLRGGLEQV